MIVTIWQIGPRTKSETLKSNPGKGKNRLKDEEPVQGLWKRALKEL